MQHRHSEPAIATFQNVSNVGSLTHLPPNNLWSYERLAKAVTLANLDEGPQDRQPWRSHGLCDVLHTPHAPWPLCRSSVLAFGASCAAYKTDGSRHVGHTGHDLLPLCKCVRTSAFAFFHCVTTLSVLHVFAVGVAVELRNIAELLNVVTTFSPIGRYLIRGLPSEPYIGQSAPMCACVLCPLPVCSCSAVALQFL